MGIARAHFEGYCHGHRYPFVGVATTASKTKRTGPLVERFAGLPMLPLFPVLKRTHNGPY